ncbi:MAG: hypothetical protein KAT58_10515 [candidate division Zixibacteria bacterium]|nr:hypothetical protein [candidate division Zixibacteria bacterium]
MIDRKLLIVSITAFVLAALLALALPMASAQPADSAPAIATELSVASEPSIASEPSVASEPSIASEPSVAATVTVDQGDDDAEVTAGALGTQIKKTISDWRTLGCLAGLAALITLLMMILKFKPINALLVRWGVKWLKPILTCLLGGVSAGIASYMVDGDVLNAIIAGLVIVGPVAIGFFEISNKVKARNRDKGKAAEKSA